MDQTKIKRAKIQLEDCASEKYVIIDIHGEVYDLVQILHLPIKTIKKR